MRTEAELRPITDLFDRVLGIDVPVVAFELDEHDLERWKSDHAADDEPMLYRSIPIRSRLEGESRFRFMGKSGVFGYHAFSKSLSGLIYR
jgi:hypothetical protein